MQEGFDKTDVTPQNVDAYLLQHFKKRSGEDTQVRETTSETKIEATSKIGNEQALERELNSLVKLKNGATKQTVESVMAKAGLTIDNYCICPQCMYKNPQGAKETGVYYLQEEKSPIEPKSIPEEFVTRFNANPIQTCPEHKVPFELFPKAVRDYSMPADQIDFLIISKKSWFTKEKTEEINREAKITNSLYRIIGYTHRFDFRGKTKEREMQAIVFFDKEAFQEKFKRDRSAMEKQNFLKQLKGLPPINEHVTEQSQVNPEITSQAEELLPEGKLEITEFALKIKYAGKKYVFQNKTALLNSILGLVGFGVKISPDDPSLIIFVDPKYIEQYGMTMKEKEEASRGREKAIRTLIGIDKRITNDIAPNLEKILKTAENNPENREIAGKALSKNLFIENW